jgi:5-methylcytosine-specific restriction endonuclease McrA
LSKRLWFRNGYLWDPEAYQYEHRLVMEHHLGRKLSTHEFVHHRDGNRSNNDLSNLELTHSRPHGQQHNRKLTAAEASEIRGRLLRGESGNTLAHAFGVGIATISRIKHGRAYR